MIVSWLVYVIFKRQVIFSLYITSSKDGLETATLVLAFDIRIPDQHWCVKAAEALHTLPAILNKNKKIDHKEDNCHC